jgi:dolichol-phosphate mannosyltransferase
MKKMLKLAGDGITSFSNKPLKAPLAFGIALTILSLLYFVLSVVLTAVGIWNIVHVLFSLVFCFIGALFISLGIFGLYLGRIYDEAKARPIYIIDEKINF